MEFHVQCNRCALDAADMSFVLVLTVKFQPEVFCQL